MMGIKNSGILDFSWGDTRGVRKILCETYPNLWIMDSKKILNYGYPPIEGDKDLVEKLKHLTKKLTGFDYNYITITSGCTQAVNACLFAEKNKGYVITRRFFYPLYPSMANLAGLEIKHERKSTLDSAIIIADSPSNPEGKIGMPISTKEEDFVIWDGAYQSPTYGMRLGISPFHRDEIDVFCGSLSKLTGLNGIRLGWTATNNEWLNSKIKDYIKNSVCGVSVPSQDIANEILKDEDKLNNFFISSALLINDNKEELLRLKNFFGSDDISEYGMFAFFEVDEKMLNTIKRANIVFTDGIECGAFGYVRINLGNTKEMTKEMVERILREDRA